MAPRILDSKAPDVEDVLHCVTNDMLIAKGGYTENAMTWSAEEMRGLVRTTAAAQVLRGPLVLAKGKLAGTSRAATFDFATVNGKNCRVSMEEAERTAGNAALWGAWRLTFEGNGERLSVPVGDFWSLSRCNDAGNWFSVWF